MNAEIKRIEEHCRRKINKERKPIMTINESKMKYKGIRINNKIGKIS